MTWELKEVPEEEVTAQYTYDISKRHRLIPANVEDAVKYFRRLASNCLILNLEDGEGGLVAELIISDIIPNDSAEIAMIPCPKYFAPGVEFAKDIREAMEPMLTDLINRHNLRRVTSFVPRSRHRTSKALLACGFKKEGVMRDALEFVGKDGVQDKVILGLLPREV